MSDPSDPVLTVLEEMRDLLRLLAEPAIAERDKRHREVLRSIAGHGKSNKSKAIGLMDGSRTQARIVGDCGIHKGQLSELVKTLRDAGLLTGDPKQPELAIRIPPDFFEDTGERDV